MKKRKNKKNGLFLGSFIFAIIFLLSPMFLRLTIVHDLGAWFLDSLGIVEYKSSYVETIGGIIGTILAISGTLFLQDRIDKKTDEEKRIKEENELRYRIIVIYYDFKLAFQELEKIYCLLVTSAFLINEDNINKFYDSASKIELYIDKDWIRNVAALHEKFEEKRLEEIFLIYGDISSIKSGLKSGDRGMYQTYRLISLISKFFSGIERGEPQFNRKYIEVLEYLKTQGKINSD